MIRAKLAAALVCTAALTMSCGDDGAGPSDGNGGGGPTPTTLTPSADNTLYETVPATPPTDTVFTNGGGTRMFAGKTAGRASKNDIPRIRRALVKFEVHSVIPPGVTIDSVCLELTAIKGPNADPYSFSLHRVTMDWGEGTVEGGGGQGGGGAPDPNDVTWDHTFYPDSRWTTRGGDFVGAASAVTTVGSANEVTYKWGSTTMMTADVQGWLDTPADNFGWVLIGAEAPTDSVTAKVFGTREQLREELQPKLKIYHTGP